MKSLKQIIKGAFAEGGIIVSEAYYSESETIGVVGNIFIYKHAPGKGQPSNVLVVLHHKTGMYVGNIETYSLASANWNLEKMPTVVNMKILPLAKYSKDQRIDRDFVVERGTKFVFLHKDDVIVPPFQGVIKYKTKGEITVKKGSKTFVIDGTDPGKFKTYIKNEKQP